MTPEVQTLGQKIKEYTDHAYVHATVLGVAGILTILTFAGDMVLNPGV